MVIAQISDLHISLADEFPYDIDVRQNLINALNIIVEKGAEQIIITGDLAYTYPDPIIYSWIRATLDDTQIPYLLIPGNHDDADMLAQIFGVEHLLKDGWLYYRNDLAGTPCLFLDSSIGLIEEKQLKWLKKNLRGRRKHTLIFVHHPILDSGVHYMEYQHKLKLPQKIIKILEKHKKTVHIFCGHYHVERSVHYKNIHMHITPSCFFQLQADQPTFAIDHCDIGLRWIDLTKGHLTHYIEYIQGAQPAYPSG